MWGRGAFGAPVLTPSFPNPGAKVGQGGVGTVYVDPRSPGWYLKRFKQPLKGADAAALLRLIGVSEWARPSDHDLLTSRTGWPLEAFGTQHEVLGFAMKAAPDDAYFDLVAAGRPTRQLLQSKYLMNEAFFRAKAISSEKPACSGRDKIEIAIDLLEVLSALHTQDLVYGDVSGNNVCVRLGPEPRVYLLDADSIVPPDVRRANMVRTPDWAVPDQLDPMEADRSLAALFVWRLFLEMPTDYPGRGRVVVGSGGAWTSVSESIAACYGTGSEVDFGNMKVELRRLRTQQDRAAALHRALESGHARVVLRELEEGERAGLRAAAAAQVALESEIEASEEQARHKLLRRAIYRSGQFVLDVASPFRSSVRPGSVDDLRQMLLDARESEIADAFVSSGLGQIERDTWLERGIAHALVQAGHGSVTYVVQPEVAEISYAWPSATFVNRAEITVVVDGRKSVAGVAVRDPSGKALRRTLRVPGGGTATVRIRTGSASPSGLMVIDARTSTVQIPVPAPPVNVPVRRRSSAGSIHDDVGLIDEEAEARRLIEERATRRRRIGIASGALAGSVAAGVAALLLLAPGDAGNECIRPSLDATERCRFEATGRLGSADLHRNSDR